MYQEYRSCKYDTMKNIDMNFKTEHMISKLFITAILLCLLPTYAAFGQQLKKENLRGAEADGGQNYAVFYSSGMPVRAIWPLRRSLMKNGRTERHTALSAIGSNTDVNDKIPFRFIIAPADGDNNAPSAVTTTTWAEAVGFNASENSRMIADGTAAEDGCAIYKTREFPSGWRLPTQREMMVMWLFQEGINAIYPSGQLSTADKYWTATEKDASNAWLMDFSTATPQSTNDKKSNRYRFRCVRDY